ncbi:MAG: chemotaxis protein CheC [Mariprofundus sp.]|nr:chemotaxis protein CheC [Mariprofundus sp.]
MDISSNQKDALTELINIGVGHAASTLNFLIDHKIRLTVPEIEIKSLQELKGAPPVEAESSSVSMNFHGDFSGNTSLTFPLESARTLVAVLTGEAADSAELDDLRSGTLAEVGNILLNGVMGSLSNMLAASLDYSVPTYQEGYLNNLLGYQQAEAVLMARAIFYIDELCISGNIILFFELESFHALLKAIDEEVTA